MMWMMEEREFIFEEEMRPFMSLDQDLWKAYPVSLAGRGYRIAIADDVDSSGGARGESSSDREQLEASLIIAFDVRK